MLVEKKIKISDGTLIWFCDASHGDCDEARSTCCYIGFYQGGVVDMSSFVGQPIPHSTAESETIAISIGSMACAYVRMGIADILFDDHNRPWTIPMISDSSAAIAMNSNDKPTKRNKHIDRRYFYGREECLASKIEFHHIDADHSLADLATKNLTAEEAAYKLSIVEYPVSDHHIGTKAIHEYTIESKKGDGDSDDDVIGNEDDVTIPTPAEHATAKHMYRTYDNGGAITHEKLCKRECTNISGELQLDRSIEDKETHVPKDMIEMDREQKDRMKRSLCSDFQVVDDLQVS
jgi:hypothetical protein